MDNPNITISTDLFLKIFVQNSTIDCVSKDKQIISDLSKLSSNQVTLNFISNYIQKKINDFMIEQYRYLNKINYNQKFNDNQNESIYDSIYSNYSTLNYRKKLGPPKVQFDLNNLIGQITIDNSTNTLLSNSFNSGFATIKTQSCYLISGKWQYEVLLLSKGIMQLGWASTGGKNGSMCNFSLERGVGDSLNSYSYDGNRKKKWNYNSANYGERWEVNDVIGVCIDLDECTISFYRNGKFLGVAFDSLPVGQNIAYFPAISLAYNEKIIVNFGSFQFKYPIDNYQSLEQQDQFEIIKANMLIEWLFNLILLKCQINNNEDNNNVNKNQEENIYSNLTNLNYSSNINQCKFNYQNHTSSPIKSNLNDNNNLFFYLTSSLILEELEPLLINEYIIETCLFKHLILYHTKDEIHQFLDCIWSLLNDKNQELFFNSVVLIIIYGYQFSHYNTNNDEEILLSELNYPTSTYSILSSDTKTSINLDENFINFINQKQYLNLFLLLIEHKRTRIYLLNNILFKKNLFFQLLDTKLVFDNNILHNFLFPNLTINDLKNHFKKFKSNNDSSSIYSNIDKLNRLNENKKWHNLEFECSIIELETIQNMIIDTLIQDEQSRTIFIEKFNLFLIDLEKKFINLNNRHSNLQTSFSTPLSVLLSVFHRMCSLIRNQYENVITSFPLEFFIDSKYCSETRIGGLYSYLNKNHQKEISIYKFELSNTNPLIIQIFIMIDHLIKLYTLGVHKQLGKYNGIKELLIEFDNSLENLNKLNLINKNESECNENNYFNLTKSILEQEYINRGHQYVLLNSIIFKSDRKQDLIWLLKIILLTFDQASSAGCVFSYLPNYYLNSIIQIIEALRFYFNNESISNNQIDDLNHNLKNRTQQQDELEYKEVLKLFALFVVDHFNDEKVVNNDHKEMIAQSLISLISSKHGLNILENISIEYRLNLIKKLTQQFENRPWTHSNWILLRIWRGSGFAFKKETFIKLTNNLSIENLNYFTSKNDNHQFSDCNPSIVFQQLLSDYFNNNPKKAYLFLTSLLNQLNFSFSEFVTMLQEIQNLSIRQEAFYLDSRQLKIACTCYDLSNSLLRVLEMILHYNVSLILTNNNLTTFNPLNDDRKCIQSTDHLFNETFDLNSINLRNYFVNNNFNNEFENDDFDSNLLLNNFNNHSNLDNEFNFDKYNNDKFNDNRFDTTKQTTKQTIKDFLFHHKQETNEILLQQLCSICNQIINRIIMSSNLFKYVRQQITNLESISEFNILSSVISILIELIKNEKTRYLSLSLLINDLNFQLSSYLYLIGETKLNKSKNQLSIDKRSNNFTKYLNEDEIKELRRVIIYIINFNERNEKLKSFDDFNECELCTICYANPKRALFLPCKHQSCTNCIQLYFLRKGEECFFCKSKLEKVLFIETNQTLYPHPQKIKTKN